MQKYPKVILKAAKAAYDVLEKEYPEIINQVFDSSGMPADEGNTFYNRLAMGIYIELCKAGAIK